MAYIKEIKEDLDRQFGSSRERQRISADRIQTEVSNSCRYSYACRGNPRKRHERTVPLDALHGRRELFERGDGKYRKFENDTWNTEEGWDVQTFVDKLEQLTILELLTQQKLFCSQLCGQNVVTDWQFPYNLLPGRKQLFLLDLLPHFQVVTFSQHVPGNIF